MEGALVFGLSELKLSAVGRDRYFWMNWAFDGPDNVWHIPGCGPSITTFIGFQSVHHPPRSLAVRAQTWAAPPNKIEFHVWGRSISVADILNYKYPGNVLS